jgi:outer membrane protein OmpA-like peptidoglycan-associated protein
MAERVGDRAATGSPGNGAGTELAQLRQLLIGEELSELASIRGRLEDSGRRSVDLAQVLPDAIKAARAKALREALEPVFEKIFQSSVRKHTKELAEAIYPVIGPALRNSIAAAIREFAESLNLMVEKSLSFRAIRWRIEALTTGRPFGEILLSRSLLYSVQHVFLVHRKSGLLLCQVAGRTSVLKDADLVSGMLAAIQDFVSDSFVEGGQDLETVDAGRFKLWIQYGSKAMLVGAVTGSPPAQLRGVFRNALDRIHETLYTELDTFRQDDLSVFDGAQPYLVGCLLGQSAPQGRKPILPWLLATAVILLMISFFAYQARQQIRWNRYFAGVKELPGIVVTGIEKQGGRYVVTGLRDPKAPDPANLLREQGLDPARIKYEWQPFLSLNTPFAAERDLETAKQQIETQVIRFEVGSARLPLAEMDRVESLAEAIHRVFRAYPNSRVTVTGHADEIGSDETNAKLSLDRALGVIAVLAEQGVSAGRLQPVGVGKSRPLLRGETDWDRASNRSVSFQLSGVPRQQTPDWPANR